MLRVSHCLRLFSIGLALSALTLTSFVSAQLPVDVPREDLFIFDQIFRRSPTGNYNGWINGNSDAHRNALSFDTLWYVDVETAETRNGLAAEEPIYNDDFTTLTVKLRDNIYWSDGELFDADDYVFTLETLKATEGMRFHSDLNLFVESIEKVDQFTFNLHLKESNSRMHYSFLAVWHGIYPMPEHIVRGQDPMTWQNNDPHVTTAAYNQTEADPNGFWELFERRDDWERSVAGVLTGNAGPKYILSILYGTSDRKAIAMARNELDVFFNVDFEAFEAVTDASDASSSWFKDFPWAYPNEANFRVLTFNLDDEKFADKRVRWALTLALDIVELHTEYIGGVTRVTALPMPATATLMELYHNPMDEWLQNFEIEIEPGVMYQPYDTTVRSRIAAWADGKGYALPEDHRDFFGTNWWKFDTDAATRLLEQAGFSRAKNGSWLLPNGDKFTIELIAPPDEPDSFRTATAAADMWANFGIDTDLQGLDRNLWSNLCNQGDYDVCSNWRSYTGPTGDVWGGIRTLHTDFYVPSGELQITGNLGRIQSAEIDRIATEMASLLPTDPANLALGVEFQKEWLENMYGIPVISFKKFVTFNETYWTNVPSFENAIGQPLYWFAGGKFTFQNLQKVGE
jgi:peptide/nickel transport system substrate-binding protein